MTDLFAEQTDALGLANRLRELRIDVTGLDALAIRDAIASNQMEGIVAGRQRNGKGTEDFESAFERVFREPLHPKKKRRARQKP